MPPGWMSPLPSLAAACGCRFGRDALVRLLGKRWRRVLHQPQIRRGVRTDADDRVNTVVGREAVIGMESEIQHALADGLTWEFGERLVRRSSVVPCPALNVARAEQLRSRSHHLLAGWILDSEINNVRRFVLSRGEPKRSGT